MHSIDLHILYSEGWPKDLLDRAIASIGDAPVNLHLSEYLGHMGEARARAYSLGSAPYVCFIDADDELVPKGLETLLATLEDSPKACGAYGAELMILPDGSQKVRRDEVWRPVAQLTLASALHNSLLMRRSAVAPRLEEIKAYPLRAERLLRGLVTLSGPWVACQEVGYKWYVRNDGLHTTPDLKSQKAITKRLTPILMSWQKRLYKS